MVFFFIKHEEVLCQKHLLINTSDFTLDTLDLDIKFFLSYQQKWPWPFCEIIGVATFEVLILGISLGLLRESHRRTRPQKVMKKIILKCLLK